MKVFGEMVVRSKGISALAYHQGKHVVWRLVVELITWEIAYLWPEIAGVLKCGTKTLKISLLIRWLEKTGKRIEQVPHELRTGITIWIEIDSRFC